MYRLDFVIPADHWVLIKENQKIDKYSDLASEMKKAVEHEDHGYTSCSWCTRNIR